MERGVFQEEQHEGSDAEMSTAVHDTTEYDNWRRETKDQQQRDKKNRKRKARKEATAAAAAAGGTWRVACAA